MFLFKYMDKIVSIPLSNTFTVTNTQCRYRREDAFGLGYNGGKPLKILAHSTNINSFIRITISNIFFIPNSLS